MSVRRESVAAVVRLDRYAMRTDDPSLFIKVQSIVPSFEEAEQEAQRLNDSSDSAKVVYFAQVTRWFPDGRAESPT